MKKLSKWQYIVLLLILLFNVSAQAQIAPLTDVSLVNMITASMQASSGKLFDQAVKWLGGFMLIQFLVTNLGLLKSGADLEAVWPKFLGSILWFGFCVYALENGPNFIDAVGLQMFGDWGANMPSPGALIASTLAMTATLLSGAVIVGQFNGTAGQILTYVGLGILFIGMGFAIKIFMIQMELSLVVMLSPLSFSLLGMNALKDQGIAPFKALISLAYRIILLGIILSAFGSVGSVMKSTITSFDFTDLVSIPKTVATILTAFSSYVLLAFLAYKSDSIAASLASGSTNMGTSDVASAAAAGAALGSTAASGAAALAGAKPVQGMGDFMKSLSERNKVGVSNATTDMGTGGLDTSVLKPDGPNMSKSDSSQIGGATDVGSGDSASKGATTSSAGESGGAQSGVPGYQGTPNPLPDQGARDPARDAAREQRRQERAGGSAASAAVEGGSSLEKQVGDLVNTLGNQQGQKKGFRDRMSDLNQHVAQESAAVHVSINANND